MFKLFVKRLVSASLILALFCVQVNFTRLSPFQKLSLRNLTLQAEAKNKKKKKNNKMREKNKNNALPWILAGAGLMAAGAVSGMIDGQKRKEIARWQREQQWQAEQQKAQMEGVDDTSHFGGGIDPWGGGGGEPEAGHSESSGEGEASQTLTEATPEASGNGNSGGESPGNTPRQVTPPIETAAKSNENSKTNNDGALDTGGSETLEDLHNALQTLSEVCKEKNDDKPLEVLDQTKIKEVRTGYDTCQNLIDNGTISECASELLARNNKKLFCTFSNQEKQTFGWGLTEISDITLGSDKPSLINREGKKIQIEKCVDLSPLNIDFQNQSSHLTNAPGIEQFKGITRYCSSNMKIGLPSTKEQSLPSVITPSHSSVVPPPNPLNSLVDTINSSNRPVIDLSTVPKGGKLFVCGKDDNTPTRDPKGYHDLRIIYLKPESNSKQFQLNLEKCLKNGRQVLEIWLLDPPGAPPPR